HDAAGLGLVAEPRLGGEGAGALEAQHGDLTDRAAVDGGLRGGVLGEAAHHMGGQRQAAGPLGAGGPGLRVLGAQRPGLLDADGGKQRPTWAGSGRRPARSARVASSWASSVLSAMGFSQTTSLPASSAARTCSAWTGVGLQMSTTSTAARSESRLSWILAPNC